MPQSLTQCYALISTALKSLVTGKPSKVLAFKSDHQQQQQQQQQLDQIYHPGSLAVVCASLPKDVREAGIRRILDKIVESDSEDVIRVVAETLISCDRLDDVLRLPPQPLEPFLCEFGALNKHLSAQPTTRDEARYIFLLSKLYGNYGQEGVASDVCVTLAERKVADCLYPSLEERMELFVAALNYGTTKDTSTGAFKRDSRRIEEIEGKAKVLQFQMRLENALRIRVKRLKAVSEDGAFDEALVLELEKSADDLRENVKTLSDLYNDVARPRCFWDICLEIVAWARPQQDVQQQSSEDALAVPRELWDNVILDAVEDVLCKANETHTRRAIVAAACAAVVEIAPKIFTESAANNAVAFPICQITCRIETLANGQWGALFNSPRVDESEQPEDDDVADCLLASVRGNCQGVQRAYDRLLAPESRRMHDEEIVKEMHHALQSTNLKLRMLRSVLRVMHAWDAATGHGDLPGEDFGRNSDVDLSSSRKSYVRASIGDICLAYARVAKEFIADDAHQNLAKDLVAAFEQLGDRFLRDI